MKDGLSKVRLGVVGCGRVTELRHLPALREVREFEVAALSDSDDARLESVAGRFGVGRRYRGYRELIEDGGVEAVAVCVPPKLHAEVALASLAAGKHTFVEKPLALGLEECDLLSGRADADASLKVLVGFNMRWHRLAREARARVRDGELGAVKLVRTVFTSGIRLGADFADWRRGRETGGGVLFELGTHHFDLLRFLLGDEIEEVYAASPPPDETAVFAARTRGGAQIVSAFSEGTGENHEFEIYGERGWLRVACYRADGLERFSLGQYPGSVGTRAGGLGRTLRELPRIVRQLRRGGDYVATYAGEWRHFADAILKDAPLESTLGDGRRALEIVLAAMEASETGRAVKLAGRGEAVARAGGF
jgi:myo-inositol 2-dehydrogenase / D-chiro-inositol 1-dehydrogenase